MKIMIIICCLLLSIFDVKSQDIENSIIWSKNYKLSYDDFQGTKLDSLDFATARSWLEIFLMSSSDSNNNRDYKAFTLFDKGKSFSLSRDSSIINHEQLHFDIQELFARKIRKEFENLKKNKLFNSVEYNKIYMKYQDSAKSYHAKYDKETIRSYLVEEQLKWEIKIKNELKFYDSYNAIKLYGLKEEF